MNEYTATKKLFGKEIEIALQDIDQTTGEAVADAAYTEGLRLQKIFDFYDDSSELSLLNKNRKLKASKELLEVVEKALEFSRLTNGEYDISLGKLIMKRKTGGADTKSKCSYKDIKAQGNLITLENPDVLIDLGSVAKGYIADKMIECLKSEGVLSGLVDARGDIRVFGEHQETIGIQHPRNNEKMIAHINLKNSAVATSGDYNQYKNTFENCHIINSKELISVTVVASSLMIADLFATALFVSGKAARKRLLNKNSYIKAMTIDKEMNLMHYNNFEGIMTGANNEG